MRNNKNKKSAILSGLESKLKILPNTSIEMLRISIELGYFFLQKKVTKKSYSI